MGMEGVLRRVSEFELAGFRRNPGNFYSGLATVSPQLSVLQELSQRLQQSAVFRRIRERALSGAAPLPEDVELYRRELEAAYAKAGVSPDELASERIGLSRDGRKLRLHKSWHCLHYLLTGKSWETGASPLGKAILGGRELPDINQVMGYGPARYLLPGEVSQVAHALANFAISEALEAYDRERAETLKVYVPHHQPDELREMFNQLRDFYDTAAAQNEAMLLWIH